MSTEYIQEYVLHSLSNSEGQSPDKNQHHIEDKP